MSKQGKISRTMPNAYVYTNIPSQGVRRLADIIRRAVCPSLFPRSAFNIYFIFHYFFQRVHNSNYNRLLEILTFGTTTTNSTLITFESFDFTLVFVSFEPKVIIIMDPIRD